MVVSRQRRGDSVESRSRAQGGGGFGVVGLVVATDIGGLRWTASNSLTIFDSLAVSFFAPVIGQGG